MLRSLGVTAVMLICLASAYGAKPKSQTVVARPASEEQRQQKRVALVIGNGQYATIPALPNAINDANDMCRELKELGFQVVCRNNLRSKREFKDLIFSFTRKLDPDTAALFYYAGHGIEVEGVNYLLPTDTLFRTRSDIQDEGFNVNYLMSELDDRRTELNIIILDACRNDPLGKQYKDSPFTGLAAQFNAPPNSIIIFATSPGRVALDGTGRNGLFTRHLLSSFNIPGIPVETALKYIISGVREEAAKVGFQQTPWINFSYSGKFCFAGCTPSQSPNKILIEDKTKPVPAPIESAEEAPPAQPKNRDAGIPEPTAPKPAEIPVIPVF